VTASADAVAPAADGTATVPAVAPPPAAAAPTTTTTAETAEPGLAAFTVVAAGDGAAPAALPTLPGTPAGDVRPVVETSGTPLPEPVVLPAAAGAAAGAADPSAPPVPPVAVPAASATGDGTADPGPAPAAPSGPVAVPSAGAGGSRSAGAGAGGPGTGSGNSAAPPADSAPEVFPVVSGTAAPAAVSAPAVAAGATGSAAATPVGSQVASRIAVLRGGPDGAQTMTLVLNPESLGPVEVSVTLSRGTVDLTLRGAHDMGRAALLDGLPDLRRDLEAAGLSCSRLEVDRDTGGSWLTRHSAEQQAQQQARQQGSGDRGRQDRGENRSRPWGAPADTAVSGPTPMSQRTTSSGVDWRV
jgi:flagellar hook-length control protein FliK